MKETGMADETPKSREERMGDEADWLSLMDESDRERFEQVTQAQQERTEKAEAAAADGASGYTETNIADYLSDEYNGFEGEKNETFTTKRGKIVRDEEGNPVMRKRANFGNPFEYTPIQKGEHASSRMDEPSG